MTTHWFLIARIDDAYGAARRHMYGTGPESQSANTFVLFAFVAIAVLWISIYCWDKCRKQGFAVPNTKNSLFQELCQAHALTRGERALLNTIVHTKRLEEPSVLFIDPSILGNLAGSNSSEARTCSDIHEKLFGPKPSAVS